MVNHSFILVYNSIIFPGSSIPSCTSMHCPSPHLSHCDYCEKQFCSNHLIQCSQCNKTYCLYCSTNTYVIISGYSSHSLLSVFFSFLVTINSPCAWHVYKTNKFVLSLSFFFFFFAVLICICLTKLNMFF